MRETSYLLSGTQFDGTVSLDQIGSKATNLVQMQRYLDVPKFYVITSCALRAALDAQHPGGCSQHLLHRFASGSEDDARDAAEELRAMVQQLEWPSDLAKQLHTIHNEHFGHQTAVVVRSSTSAEDMSRHSFAGIYESVLNVRGATSVLEAAKRVYASYFSDRVIAYRHRIGIQAPAAGLAVIVQAMIQARQSGVMFSCNPATENANEIVIEAVWGHGEALVQGQVNAASYCLPKSAYGMAAGRRTTCTDSASQTSDSERVLTDSQISTAADAALLLEKRLGCHQDIEFCFDQKGKLFVLQSRPVTFVEKHASGHMIWDNSNIIESYADVTTPLTFSFIRRAYAIVYKCFAEVMGIAPHLVHGNRNTFENMLGFFRGRVYYNLKNWYRLVRLFPGYQYNSGFMESMMGLKEPIVLDDERPQAGILRRWFVELPALVGLVARISWKFLRIESIVRQFEEHFDSYVTRWQTIDFGKKEPHELLALYREMEAALLWNWKAPIINDFYVMVFYGCLKKLTRQWCGDQTGSLTNGLLCGSGDVASAEPARCILKLTRIAAQDQVLRAEILRQPVTELRKLVATDPRFETFQTALECYLDEYGLRCENELKLEAYSHRDRPEQVFELIRAYLRTWDDIELYERSRTERQQTRRREAERAAVAAIAASSTWFPRQWVFRSVLQCARRGIRQREKLRFARTKIYAIARSMFRAVGQQFADAGALNNAEDVFYLTTDEVWSFVEGTAVSTNLSGLVAVRRKEFDAYRDELPPPDRRFETRGIAYVGNDFRQVVAAKASEKNRVLQGVGCCPGVVEGKVQIVRDASHYRESRGDILVAARTDPGWVPLFPAFRGILLERGSVLSHSAIVAREMGIPTIVAIPSLLDRLENGQRVRIDAAAGQVELLSSVEPALDKTIPTSAVTGLG